MTMYKWIFFLKYYKVDFIIDTHGKKAKPSKFPTQSNSLFSFAKYTYVQSLTQSSEKSFQFISVIGISPKNKFTS